MFQELWNHRLKQATERSRMFAGQLQRVQKQIEGFLDRIVEANALSVVAAYEKRIAELDLQKLEIAAHSEAAAVREKVLTRQLERRWRFSQTLGNYGLPAILRTAGPC